MLQKYHPNPLSHFLALHNSQANSHNHVVDAHTLATTIANSHSQFHHHHHHPPPLLHHQHHQNPSQQNQTAAALLAANQHQHNTHLQLVANSHNSPSQQQNLHSPSQTNNTPPHHHQPDHQTIPSPQNNSNHNHSILRHQHARHTQQLIEAAAANTTLDAGKSFTIAAILGLQKSAMESSCKEYTNNVINLSLNGGSSNSTIYNQNEDHDNINDDGPQQQILSTPGIQRNPAGDEQHRLHRHSHAQHQRDSLAHNNNNNNNREVTNLNLNKSSSNICNSFHITTPTANNNNNMIASNSSTVNSFNCDNVAGAAATVLMNRYLPGVSGTNSFAATPVLAHSRANSFVATAPSALQSLQQLHQQHAAAHQSTLSFQREKLKSENNSKKSSLKNKRVRTIFTPEQLERLEAEFERQQYMVGPERLYLAHTLQLTEAQVKVWFQNRRIKWRKHHLEMTQQRLALLRQTQIVPGNTEQAPVKIDGTDDEDCDPIKREDLRDLNDSRQDTESELSVCNDSMDAESIIDDEEDT
ncbi:uncharacterized protein LOC142220168 [Haematobia irritans]|uniref:uncharacterized protein LOC142220168 n=1 Tax=Haematobia irritans TaxID=7368 RepID=UPI003F506A1A